MGLGVVQDANWHKMLAGRDELPTPLRFELEPSYEFGANGRLVQQRRAAGSANPQVPRAGDGPMIVLAEPIRHHTKGGIYRPIVQVPLLTATTKMSCMSFSLPAGPVWSRGTCPMAQRQSVVQAAQRATDPGAAEVHLQFEAAPDRPVIRRGEPVAEIPPKWVCDTCYAGKGNYDFSINAMRQAIRQAWLKAALAAPHGFFVAQMLRAIDNFRNLPKYRGPGKWPPQSQESIGINANYFRWHDSGDVYNVRYWEAIKEIARRRPQVVFWMPTRQWAAEAWRERFAREHAAGEIPPNLVVRPSALFIDAPAPRVDGLAAGTLVTREPVGSLRVHRQAAGRPFKGPSVGIFDPDEPQARRLGARRFPERRVVAVGTNEVWDCPAYLGDSEKTRSCMAQNCRVCWTRPDVEVSYDAH